MNIRIYVKNALTKEVVIDHTVTIDDYDSDLMWTNMQLNHKGMSEMMPDCHVNFEFDNGDFIAGVPLNMERDQERVVKGEMTWQEEMSKWHGIEFPEFSLS